MGQALGWVGRQLTEAWSRFLTISAPPPHQRLLMDSVSESRSVVDGGSLRSAAQGSARSLPAPQEPTNVALYQVKTSAHPLPQPEEL